jgi:hypothetical protein
MTMAKKAKSFDRGWFRHEGGVCYLFIASNRAKKPEPAARRFRILGNRTYLGVRVPANQLVSIE